MSSKETTPEKKSYTCPIPPTERPFLNVVEAAALVGLKPSSIRLAIRRGQLRYSQPGTRAYLVRPIDVIAWAGSNARVGGQKVDE